jgi:hypothetical protein
MDEAEQNGVGQGVARRRRTTGFWLARVRAGEVEEAKREDLKERGQAETVTSLDGDESGDARGRTRHGDA